jgi:hypothetical protein
LPPLFAISLDIVTERESGAFIAVHAWHLPVTESFRSRQRKGGQMSGVKKFDLREWLVAPIVVPLFFGLLIAGVILTRWSS